MIDESELVDRLALAMKKAVTQLPPDVIRKLEEALGSETSDAANMQLKAILDNVKLADDEELPLCQDTGVQIFFVKAGYDFPYLNEVRKAIPKAIEKATKEVPLRPNTVDPFTGENPKNNLGHNMPAVTIDLVDGDDCIIHSFPKGGGSENMSALWMLTPTAGFDAMKKNILKQVNFAGGKPCPPVILGIGIGGGADIALKLAKKALLRPLDQPNQNEKLAAMEKDILNAVNELGVGPMGLGGKTTALAVHIEYTARHPATFPTAMVVQCWCNRRAIVKIDKNGVITDG
jgi:fumarate hydratase subunit alpha